ncbi:MAG: membrane-bound lytic murein transglycosylase B [Pseudohongiellaceae bacterium]|jgi:membrane-bound lytic murein transglycosylase B
MGTLSLSSINLKLKLQNTLRITATKMTALFFLPAVLISGSVWGQDSEAFDSWLAQLKQEARETGISDATLAIAFSEITQPVKAVIEKDRSQPERVQTYDDYLTARVTQWKVDTGKELMTKHNATLASVSKAFGVQPRFIAAIWGMETNFGTYPIREPLFNVLATLAFDDRRAAYFRGNFLAALKILDSGFPSYEQLTSSWAGAMGQSQFMPDSYLEYAVDFDQDGRADIWTNEADVFASIANYFKARNWQDDQTWGRKVMLPANGEETLVGRQADGLTPDQYCKRYDSLGIWRDLQDWQELGVRKSDGGDLPTRSIPAALVLADTGDNEAYLVYRNFCSIMSYNPAFKYALSIGLLSDLLD